ncbi:myosin, partial [Thraustotheca clavata]
FTRKGGEESQLSNESRKILPTIASLLGIDIETIEKGLTTKKIKVGFEIITKGLTAMEACTSRDAVAKTIYSRVFDWLVERINQSISYETPSHQSYVHSRFIGVVDIFGFEIFATNSLEQLCINFANEKLQQLFSRFVFEMEQKEYEAEAIPWTFVDYPNNDACVALFESRPIGLFSLLDEQCVIPRGNDTQLAAKYYEGFATHSHFSSTKLQKGKTQFTIAHYAGDVVYTAIGFCDKNKDSVHIEALELLATSSHSFLQNLFTAGDARRSTAVSLKLRSFDDRSPPRRSAGMSSVVMKFKTELTALLELLNATVPHFIRCIKPNDELNPFTFDEIRVVEQLRCSGVLEAVKISRAGYPIRMLHESFQQLYRCIFPQFKSLPSLVAAMLKIDEIANLSGPVPLQVGLTKVFMVQAAYQHLNRCKIHIQSRAVRTVQRYTRGFLAKQQYIAYRKAVIIIQAFVRMLQCRNALYKRKRQANAALCIQTQWRMHQAYSVYQTRVHSIRLIQRIYRGFCGRTSAAKLRRQIQAEAIIQRALQRQKSEEESARLKRQASLQREKEIKAAAMYPQSSMDSGMTHKMAPLLPSLSSARPIVETPIVFEEFSSSESEGEDDFKDTTSTASTQETKSIDSEYEINWECGMLGLYFESDEMSGLPIVRRVHETLSTCADIFDVSPGDILLSVGGKRVHNNDIRHILRLLQEIDKPVALRFQRTQNSESNREPSLMCDEYEVLWRDNVPLGLGFKPDKKKEMPSVSKCRGNPMIPGMFNVRLGDYLTAINEISTHKVEFSRVIKLLEDGPRPVVLRFLRADLDDALDSTRQSELSVRESSIRFSRMSTMSLNPKRDDSLYNITWKEEDGPLGLVVKQALSSYYPEVTKVKPEGAIKRQPNKVQVGDLLISINNNNISKMGFRNAMHLLQIGPKPVLLTFQKQGRGSQAGIPASI